MTSLVEIRANERKANEAVATARLERTTPEALRTIEDQSGGFPLGGVNASNRGLPLDSDAPLNMGNLLRSRRRRRLRRRNGANWIRPDKSQAELP